MAIRNQLMAATLADLYSSPITDQQIIGLWGQNSIGDMVIRYYLYDASSTVTDDGGVTTVQPTLVTGSGRYLLQTNGQTNSDFNSSAGYSQIFNKPTLGSASSMSSSAFATAAQGALAASALQPTGSAAALTSFPTLNQSTTGNAATATKLGTARTINGVLFDGTANITVADSTKFPNPTGSTSQYLRGDGSLATFPAIPSAAVYSTYSAIVNQTGSSAPSVSQKQNDFGATTFAWTRTSAGVYVLTASTAVFTSGKTVLIQSSVPSALINYSYVVTSTTQVTVTTNQLAVLLTVLGATASDGLLTNTLCEVRVYS